jgi:hypothetical protein
MMAGGKRSQGGRERERERERKEIKRYEKGRNG